MKNHEVAMPKMKEKNQIARTEVKLLIVMMTNNKTIKKDIFRPLSNHEIIVTARLLFFCVYYFPCHTVSDYHYYYLSSLHT